MELLLIISSAECKTTKWLLDEMDIYIRFDGITNKKCRTLHEASSRPYLRIMSEMLFVSQQT